MRPGILTTYRTTMVQHVMRQFGMSEEEATRRVLKECVKRYKPMTAILNESKISGDNKLVATDLVTYLDHHNDDLLSPSGSFYCQHDKCTGATISMVMSKLKQRKKLKKEMLRCKAIGDVINELLAYYGQTLVKIGVNALPGNYGSPYSLFYDKGNYNAITSSGRALIGYANTCIEHVLGGNFGWFTIDQFVNHITIHLSKIDKDRVTKVMNKYHLRWVESDEYFEFVKKELSIYHKYKDFSRVEKVISTLCKEELQYFWYYQNLRHILMGNDEIFRPFLNETFDLDKIVFDNSIKPDELFKLDDALVVMVNVAFSSVVSSGSSDIQVYDLPSKMPEKAVKFVNIARYVKKRLDKLDELFDLFIFTPLCVPDVLNRKMMIRNSSVVSDTDSVIFTVKDWVEWYTHDIYKIHPETYHIACTMIYWITKAVAHSLKLFSEAHGCKGDRVYDMAMKNEFLYPTMCLADIKKHYAGIVAVQEGVILSKPSPDIKGVQFKGSDICKEATKFAENFIIKDILTDSLDKKIDGHKLIKKVMDFEMKIHQDILAGGTGWFEPLAIKPKDSYKTPMSSNWFYYLAWQEIFSKKYGEYMLPTKVLAVPISTPTPGYIDWLRKKSPTICKNLEKFILTYGKAPSKMALNPIMEKVPEELIPLIQTRDIIYDNVSPCRLILKQLGIRCGFDKDKLLFTEVYGDHSVLARATNTTKEKQTNE